MDERLGANFKTVHELFQNRLFVIPDYQRGYSWGKQQWEELVEDVDLLPLNKGHYTGTIVLQDCAAGSNFTDIHGNTLHVVDVVDGQQRLTTLVLLLDAVQKELRKNKETELADGITNTYIFTTDRNKQQRSKLRLGSDVQDFFVTRILNGGSWNEGNQILAQKNLDDAKVHFATYLSSQREKLGETFSDWLLNFRQKITGQLIVTVYPVGRESEAGVIFEVMNNRGKPITEFEKVKNYLLYVSSKLELESDHEFSRLVNETWSYIFHSLMSSGLASSDYEDQLLRVHWLMAYSPSERDWKQSKSIKERLNLRAYEKDHPGLLNALIEYVRSLRRACTAFCEAWAPNRSESFADICDVALRDAVIVAAERLPRLGNVAPFLPLLIATRLTYGDDHHLYAALVARCERYAFRVFRVLQRRAQTGRPSFFSLAHRVYTKDAIPSAMARRIDELTVYYSNSEDFRRELLKPRDWYGWSGLRYIMFEYEMHLASLLKKRPKVSWASILNNPLGTSIEHILPQTPTDNYWASLFDEEAQKRLTHDLGNLCLTVDNSVYGNKPFPDKKGKPGGGSRCYCEGEFFMERELANYDEWNETAILARREKILDWALTRWEVDMPEVRSVAIEVSASDEEIGYESFLSE